MKETFSRFISHPSVLVGWALLVVGSLAALIRDMIRENPEIPPLMKAVWVATVLYSGPLGLAIYFYSGRKQIARDTLWRRSFRSVAHCYSGCGAGEIVGVTVAAGILALGTWKVAAATFLLAYAAGFSLTVGPLLQEGVPLREALGDAFYSETASIAVMEFVAIGVDVWLAGPATMGEAVFWASLIVSLTAGLVAAYPVNVALVRAGVKEGMADPKEWAEGQG